MKNHSSNTNPLFSYVRETECFSIWYSKHALGKHWNGCSDMFSAILVQRGMICQGQCITPPISRACMRSRKERTHTLSICVCIFAGTCSVCIRFALEAIYCRCTASLLLGETAVDGYWSGSRQKHHIFFTDNPRKIHTYKHIILPHWSNGNGYHEKQIYIIHDIISNFQVPDDFHLQVKKSTSKGFLDHANPSNFDSRRF